MAYNVSITVVNITTGASATGGHALDATGGDALMVQGLISPAPPDCSGCVIILLPNGSIGSVGLGSLGLGNYLYGPVQIPAASSSFWIRAEYLPTGDLSDAVQVNLPTTITGHSVSIRVTNTTTGKSAGPNQTLLVDVGNSILISGSVTPTPADCPDCVWLSIPLGQGTLGQASLSYGGFQWGPAQISSLPSGTFPVEAYYSPTMEHSPPVNLVSKQTVAVTTGLAGVLAVILLSL